MHVPLPLHRWRYVHEARQQGIRLCGGSQVLAIEPDAVRWRDAEGNARETAADHVFITTGARPDSRFEAGVTAGGVHGHRIGDCREVRFVEGAMRDAAEVVLGL